MRDLFKDLTNAGRGLAKRPGFAGLAIATLALGIGANSAVFSVVSAALLRPLPYENAERLVTLRQRRSLPEVEDIRAAAKSFEESGVVAQQSLDYTGGAEPVQAMAGLVDTGLLRVLGVRAALGRVLDDREDRYGGARVALLSHAFWQRQFGGDPGVIGRSIPLGGESYAVVGVMPAAFRLPQLDADVFASLRVVVPQAAPHRGVHFLRTYWRLKPNVTLAQAQAELDVIARQIAQREPVESREIRLALVSLHEQVVGDVRSSLLVLFGAVGLVLLIACANFAGLLLARALDRRRELVVRAALGASRARLVRAMLSESLLLALAGAALGWLLAGWGAPALLTLAPDALPGLVRVESDWRVAAFGCALAVLTGLGFGLLPALVASRPDLNDALKDGGRSAAGVARQRARRLLVTGELALALVLLIGASLLIKGFWRLQSVPPGFDPSRTLTMKIELPEARYQDVPSQTRFREAALESLAGLPGVRSAIVSELPLSGEWLTHNFVIDGRPPLDAGTEPELVTRNVMGDYFHTAGIPLRAGRDFNRADREGTPLVGIVNESMARAYFPKGDALGSRVRWARMPQPLWITVVGIVGDVRHFGLDEPEEPALYTPYAQQLQPWKRWAFLVVKSEAGEPMALLPAVKAALQRVDPLLPVSRVRTFEQVVAQSMAQRRFTLTLLLAFAAIALLLAVAGVYGLIAQLVAQRTTEFGVRVAVGARQADILGLVLREGLRLAAIGGLLGLAGAVAATRAIASLLFGVAATDPAAFASASAALVGAALLACLVPARRAARIDPMQALRYE